MLRGSWSKDILALPTCQTEVDAHSLVIWNGPRICMGICDGEPSLVCPHSTSGRADYFGPVVNRWAEHAGNDAFCHLHFASRIQHCAAGLASHPVVLSNLQSDAF